MTADVLLVQLPVPEAAPRRCTGLAPLGPACLLLHARARGASIAAAGLLRRAGDAALLDALVAAAPRVLGLSVSVWNVERSLGLARALRAALPGISIWLGGPEVARDAWFVHRADGAWDLAVAGEGEEAFATLLAGAPPETVPGVFLPGRTGSAGRPLSDLASVHDPYISGLVEPEADGVLLAELGRGCRYRCAFCAYPQGRRTAPAASRPPVQVAELFRWARARGAREVYLLDPSLEQRPDLDELLGLLARVQGGEGIPIFAELRAEAMSTERARALRAAGIRAVEVGLQTLGPEALRLMGRRLDPARFAAGLDALRGEGIRVKVDLMTGLPGDGPAELRRTLDYLGACGALGSVQLFRTQVLPGTPLRRRARALGIRWEDRPPYRVLETPTWPADLLAATAGEVEAATGDDLAALPGPPLAMPPPGPFHRLRYPDGDGIFQYSWDLGDPDGREALARERFRNAGRWCAWWVRGPSPAAEVRLLAAAAGRLLAANPFVSLFVALELGPGEPLDALYALDAALEEGRPSRYLEGLLDGPVRPERRLGVLLPARCRGRLHPGWLAAVRSLAEVLWLAAPRDTGEASAVAAAMDLAEGEYLLLDLPDGVAMPGPEALPDPCRVIPLGLSRAWDWQERVDRRAGTDL